MFSYRNRTAVCLDDLTGGHFLFRVSPTISPEDPKTAPWQKQALSLPGTVIPWIPSLLCLCNSTTTQGFLMNRAYLCRALGMLTATSWLRDPADKASYRPAVPTESLAHPSWLSLYSQKNQLVTGMGLGTSLYLGWGMRKDSRDKDMHFSRL